LVLLLAILASALFAGNWLHNQLRGDTWRTSVARCWADREPSSSLESALRAQQAFQACTADAERVRGWFGLGVTAAVAVAGLLIVAVVPRLIERRRALRPADDRFAGARQRLAVLAGEAGLARPPLAMVGSAGQRDAFSYGVPGRYRVVLPKALAIRAPSSPFDAVVRHELQHIAHRDVALAWLARAGGYALAAIFGAPVLLALAQRDLSVLPGFAWRAAILAAGLLLARAAWLRSREHDADLRAAHAAGDPRGLLAALELVASGGPADAPRRGLRDRVRGLLGNHPYATDRIVALRAPHTVTSITPVDALTVGFFAAVALPLLGQALAPLLSATGHVGWQHPIAAGLLGPLVGATLGLGLWRDALLARVSGRAPRVLSIAAGMFAGTAAGQAASLAAAGSGSLTGQDHTLAALVIAVAAAGATVLIAGLGELWADAAPRLPRAEASWIPAILLPGILVTVTVWFAVILQFLIDQGGWTLASSGTLTVLASVPLAWAALLLAAAAAWALHTGRQSASAPSWLAEPADGSVRGRNGSPTRPAHRTQVRASGGAAVTTSVTPAADDAPSTLLPGPPPLPWQSAGSGGLGRVLLTGAGAGLAGGVTIILYRIIAGPARDTAVQEQRYYLYLALAALTAAAAGAALAAVVPRRGPGVALLAATASVVTTQASFLGLNTTLGGELTPQFAWRVTYPALALGLLLLVIATAVTPLVVAVLVTSCRNRREPTLQATAPVVTAVVLAGLTAVSTIAGRGALAPLFHLSGVVGQAAAPPPAGPPAPPPAHGQGTHEYGGGPRLRAAGGARVSVGV
jgi:Zn-dependent protease with chaperone function